MIMALALALAIIAILYGLAIVRASGSRGPHLITHPLLPCNDNASARRIGSSPAERTIHAENWHVHPEG